MAVLIGPRFSSRLLRERSLGLVAQPQPQPEQRRWRRSGLGFFSSLFSHTEDI